MVASSQRIAAWAGGFLYGSMLLGGGFLLVVIGSDSNPVWARWPWSLIPVSTAAAAMVYSATCLDQVRRGNVTDARALWVRSLLANCLVVCIVVGLTNLRAGLTLSIMELICIALHLIALRSGRRA